VTKRKLEKMGYRNKCELDKALMSRSLVPLAENSCLVMLDIKIVFVFSYNVGNPKRSKKKKEEM